MTTRFAAQWFAALVLPVGFAFPAMAQGKPTLTAQDYGTWESLTAARLAPSGRWLAYGVNRVNEENELRLRGGTRDTTIVVPYGVQSQFAATSQWVAYLIGVAPKERDRLVKEKKPVRTAFGARNLDTGDTIGIPDASAFAFSADGQFVAVTKYAAEGKKSSDVMVLSLASGTRLVLNNVTEQAWSGVGAQLAFAIMVDGAATGSAGNAVQLYDGRIGAVHVLEASSSVYRGLSWRANSHDLAALRSVSAKEFADTAHTILAWRDVGRADAAAPRVLDANVAHAVPAGFRIADYRRPSWSKDGRTLYVGLRTREPVAALPKKTDEKVSDVEIWHPKDVHVIPEQRSSEQRDLRSTLLASWLLDAPSVKALSTNIAEQTTVLEGDRFATETDRTPYPFGQMFGRRDLDIYTVDLATGARTKLLTKIRYSFGGDPTGRRHVWFDGRDYWAVDVASGARTNLTARLAGGRVDFVDREDDHPMDVLPPIGTPLWSKDGKTLLVNSAYDVWALALDGSGGRALTNGARDGLEHRVVSFVGFGGSAADRAVDVSKPVYLSLYGKRSKQSGYARLANGTVTTLALGDAQFAALAKADSSDTYLYTRQRFDESPNVYVAAGDLANAKAMSNTNSFQRDFAWGKAELMNFTSSIGKPLQAILYYPANYVPGKKYPMIVYTYELLTQGLHRYIVPRENDYYNANVFTQQGYFVLMPDIVFRPREPGISVLHSVEPAVRSVLARGLVDPARVGHAGHSQGGYEAAFLATHSSLFATAVMGAGISDMVSFAGQMHWSSVPEFDHWETGQFRMQVAPWEDVAAMTRNSPITKIHEMRAKSLLIEIGGEDPTVDMRQGVELYNYARRAGKHAVMLLYPGEGHGLGKKENAVDYERRILQWFAHYLKGEPPAAWITDGQSWLERKKLLDANK
ncbi:prolyl oligopeptidase family serine peptidase [Gemmatimonas sp.]|uniref:S9 family peptidase n=1 Tax=Gemmatimonas sp. TaxID=1962908 RepID=UPI00286DD3D4|nr:prolyl oligopeptidase family serine peptidase [Gemmatimonas sp.]